MNPERSGEAGAKAAGLDQYSHQAVDFREANTHVHILESIKLFWNNNILVIVQVCLGKSCIPNECKKNCNNCFQNDIKFKFNVIYEKSMPKK